MIVKDVLMSVRFGLGDAEAAVYSDSEIIESINSVLRYINSALVNMASSLSQKRATLTPVDGETDLPSDFIAMADLETEYAEPKDYRIINTKIYLENPLDVVYFATFTPMTSQTDTLPLPDYFYELLVRFTESFITKSIDRDTFPQVIYKEVANATTGREYAYITREMPFAL